MRHTSGLTYGFVGGNVAEIYKSKNVLDRNSSLKEMMKKVSDQWKKYGFKGDSPIVAKYV